MPQIDFSTFSGLDLLRMIIEGDLPAPSMAKTLGFKLAEATDGTAVFVGSTSAHILNPMGSVHGGWALTIIDSATGCAAMSTLSPGLSYATVSTQANFVRPILADTGDVRCEATVLARGRTIITAEARMVDSGGRLLAHGGSTLSVFQRR